jgi:hypothetical protein
LAGRYGESWWGERHRWGRRRRRVASEPLTELGIPGRAGLDWKQRKECPISRAPNDVGL